MKIRYLLSKINSSSFTTLRDHSLISLALFLLALLPRAYDLSRFVTADEAKWVYRSAQFLAAFLQGDFPATTVNLTPAVTTTWLGSLGLTAYYTLHQADLGPSLTAWLLSLPEFRADLPVLVATRWPMVIFTSLAVVIFYLLTRRLLGTWVAVVAAAFIALAPHFIAVSRVLGHDAPAVVFMTLSLLLLLIALQPSSPLPSQSPPLPSATSLLFSGLAAGLAFLSKAPTLFLIPFAGLVFAAQVWGRSTTLYFWFRRLILWLAVAYLAFVVVWPAAWVDPMGRPRAVFENAFISATDREEAEAESYWLTPDLGPAYYLVNAAFKLSPLVLIGAGVAVWYMGRSLKERFSDSVSQRVSESASRKPSEQADKNHPAASPPSHPTIQPPNPLTTQPPTLPILWLFVFVILFTIFMTLSDKRSPRYILPIFPPLAIIAAWGWFKVSSVMCQVSRSRFLALRSNSNFTFLSSARFASLLPSLLSSLFLSLIALLIALPYAPYYFTYYNPLLGGAYTAPSLVKIGWGEGLDRVGRFLQREHPGSRVGTAYASTLAPYFEGNLSDVTADHLDYIVLYVKQVQSGEPSPAFIRYFEHFGSIFTVNLNGIRYADVYPGPALQPALTLTPGLDHAILPLPISFRPLTPYGHLGEPLEVDVVWRADDPLPATPSTVTLQPLSAFDFLDEHNDASGRPVEARDMTILAEGMGQLTRLADNLVVSRHRLDIPADLTQGRYALLVDGRPLGKVDLRLFQVPAELQQISGVSFEDQIALVGCQVVSDGNTVRVKLAWQAQKDGLPDYTVFVQLLNAAHERVAGVDTPPLKGVWPTSRWVKNEVVADGYLLTMPPGLSPGAYQVIVGFYQAGSGQRLTLTDGPDYWALPEMVIKK